MRILTLPVLALTAELHLVEYFMQPGLFKLTYCFAHHSRCIQITRALQFKLRCLFFYCVKEFNIFSGSEFRLSLTQNPDYKDLKRLNESYITLRADHLSSVSCHFDPG